MKNQFGLNHLIMLLGAVNCVYVVDRPGPEYYGSFGDSVSPSRKGSGRGEGGFSKFEKFKGHKPPPRPSRPVRDDGDEESGLKAMGRSVIEGVTRFGKGVIGIEKDVTPDLEDKSHERFTGETTNYHANMPGEYSYPDEYRRNSRNRPIRYRRRRPRYYREGQVARLDDDKDEGGLTAMGRSAVEGVTRFGKGVIGLNEDVTQDMEDKSHERFTGQPANYQANLPQAYSYPNGYRSSQRNRPRSRYPPSWQSYPNRRGRNHYRHNGPVQNYESGFGNVMSSAYDGAKTFGKGVMGIGDSRKKFDYDNDVEPDDQGKTTTYERYDSQKSWERRQTSSGDDGMGVMIRSGRRGQGYEDDNGNRKSYEYANSY